MEQEEQEEEVDRAREDESGNYSLGRIYFDEKKHVQANPLTVCSRMDVGAKHREAGGVEVNPSIPNIGK